MIAVPNHITFQRFSFLSLAPTVVTDLSLLKTAATPFGLFQLVVP